MSANAPPATSPTTSSTSRIRPRRRPATANVASDSARMASTRPMSFRCYSDERMAGARDAIQGRTGRRDARRLPDRPMLAQRARTANRHAERGSVLPCVGGQTRPVARRRPQGGPPRYRRRALRRAADPRKMEPSREQVLTAALARPSRRCRQQALACYDASPDELASAAAGTADRRYGPMS